MFRRGVMDAEDGELHPFYYQHYYHYRRGYDQTRWRLRWELSWRQGWIRRTLTLAVIAIMLIGLSTLLILRARTRPQTLAQTLSTSSISTVDVTTLPPTTTAPTEIPVATPLPTLHIGGSAVVSNIQDSVLNGRKQPSRKAPLVARFKPDEQVHILEGPVEAEGLVWWRIEGQSGAGWSAERSPEGVVWLQPVGAS